MRLCEHESRIIRVLRCEVVVEEAEETKQTKNTTGSPRITSKGVIFSLLSPLTFGLKKYTHTQECLHTNIFVHIYVRPQGNRFIIVGAHTHTHMCTYERILIHCETTENFHWPQDIRATNGKGNQETRINAT